MITKMKKYTFLVMTSAYDRFLQELQSAGVVHITLKSEGMADDETLQQSLSRIDEINRILRQGAPDQLLQEKAEVEAKIATTCKEAERVAVWGNFSSKRLEELKNAGYELFFYSCPKTAFQEEWGVKIAEQGSTAYFVSVGSPVCNEQCIEQNIGTKSASELSADLEALNGLLVAADARIQAWWQQNEQPLREELKKAEAAVDWQRVTLSTDHTAEGRLSLLEGFCPVEQCGELNAKLDSMACYYVAEDPQADDKTPIKLRNNKFTKLFEPLTGMYGWPDYGEFDPTPVLGPFFLLFFALCIGDAGYGLILILLGYLIHKDKLKIDMFSGLGPIIMALGVGSTVVGYLMGGFFGIDLFAATWMPDWAKVCMFKNLGDPADGYKIMGYDVMMVLALVIGIVHICLAMTIKAVCYTKRFGFKQTVSVWGWLTLILGGLITAVLAMTNVLSQEATKIVLIVIAAVSALGIYIFNTPGRNPLINIGAGLWDTYNMATGIMGDVLSYIRLYALGLAGGMLGMAFNQLGTMVLGEQPNVGTWIGFILIVTFGHVLNLLMACLGAFVHPLRLTFVEYFKNSGYEGTGKLYKPFKKA